MLSAAGSSARVAAASLRRHAAATPTPASAAYSTLLRDKAFINGKWVNSSDGATFDVVNPATLEVIGSVPDMTQHDTAAAIGHAHIAQQQWRDVSAKERSHILRRWHDAMVANKEELGHLLTLEAGKPLAEAVGEIVYGASFIEWFAEEGRRAYGQTIPAPVGDKRTITIKQPVGVAALITPWNFPNAMIARKVGPALAAGCAVVIKPSEDTPLSALAVCDLATDAGVPPGVINVVTASRGNAAAVGNELCDNPLVRKLSFTGSTAVGKMLTAKCAATMKKVSMELGGNAPFIVFDDADVDAAVDGAMASKFRNAGQTCVCANRIFVQAGVYDEFAARLTERVAALSVGDGTANGVTTGPLINDAGVAKAESHVEDAKAKGAKVIYGGGRMPGLTGHFFEPTVLTDVDPSMQIYSEETFGPVAPLFRFSEEADVIEMANDNAAGLAGYFYTRDVARAWRVAERLEVGMVGINEGLISIESAPFGGIKDSGLGREGGAEGLSDYLETKYMCFGGI